MARFLARLPNALLWAYAIAVFAFLVVPLLVVVPVSFSAGVYLQFPPPGFSLHWYEHYFGDPQWIDATVLSVEIALCVVVLAVSIGLLAALAIVRLPFGGVGLVRILLIENVRGLHVLSGRECGCNSHVLEFLCQNIGLLNRGSGNKEPLSVREERLCDFAGDKRD